mmetsp:Transcript_45475/g.140223  ORF Transcript_45475/g.140223 Transcript_45475/m.140223 type:complete len:218 (+) Transcript_45475:265-918(+)
MVSAFVILPSATQSECRSVMAARTGTFSKRFTPSYVLMTTAALGARLHMRGIMPRVNPRTPLVTYTSRHACTKDFECRSCSRVFTTSSGVDTQAAEAPAANPARMKRGSKWALSSAVSAMPSSTLASSYTTQCAAMCGRFIATVVGSARTRLIAPCSAMMQRRHASDELWWRCPSICMCCFTTSKGTETLSWPTVAANEATAYPAELSAPMKRFAFS